MKRSQVMRVAPMRATSVMRTSIKVLKRPSSIRHATLPVIPMRGKKTTSPRVKSPPMKRMPASMKPAAKGTGPKLGPVPLTPGAILLAKKVRAKAVMARLRATSASLQSPGPTGGASEPPSGGPKGLVSDVLTKLRKKPAGASQRRALALRVEESRKRALRFGDRFQPLAVSQGGGTSLLEQIQVLDKTRDSYLGWAQLFVDWKVEEGLSEAMDPRAVLLQLLDFLDVLFLTGCNHSDGTRVLALN